MISSVILLALWMLSGLFKDTQHDTAMHVSSARSVSDVLRISPSQAVEYQPYLEVYGITEAEKSVDLKARADGMVTEIITQEGDPIKKGDVILTVEQRDRSQRLKQAVALKKQRQLEYSAADALQKQGYRSEISVSAAQAALDEADAALERIVLELGYTAVRAPFDGVLEEVRVRRGDFVGVGVFGGEGAIATIVSLDPLHIVVEVPQDAVANLKKDAMATIIMPDNTSHDATIIYQSVQGREPSRAFVVKLAMANTQQLYLAGASATVRLPLLPQQAHAVVGSALQLSDNGGVGVKIIEDNVVRFMPVQVLGEKDGHYMVSGLPAQVQLVYEGGGFVADGTLLQ